MTICRACAKSAGRSVISIRTVSYLSGGRAGVGGSSSSQAVNSAVTSSPRPQDITRAIKNSPNTDSFGERKEDLNRKLPDSKSLDYAVRRHLEFLGDDRFKIARHVLSTLQRDAFDEALHLVRKISRADRDYMVSWNHLISHLFQKQRLNAAIKLYNEAKKRGQTPTAQTYTIIFDGCAASEHPKQAVGEAIKLYHTLLRSERLQPNTKHLNAVLKVCSRAGDQEALFSILQTAEGNRKADNLTYTTILNSIRVRTAPSARKPELKGLKKDEREDTRRMEIVVSIQRAKAIWEEIVRLWRSGKLILDEELVCAMGRILKTGDREANSEILALIEQAMNIPRLDKAPLPAPQQPTEGKSAVVTTRPVSGMGFATPGRNTLSLVLESLGTTRQTSLAVRYWDIFVQEHGVIPDSENWFRLFRTLWIGKASGKAAEYITRMPPQFLRPSTVHVALGTCVRDNLNELATANADKILAYAIRTLDAVDAMTMRHYLQAVLGNHHRFRVMEEKGDVQQSQAELGKHYAHALRSLQGPLMKATNNLAHYQAPKGPLKGRAAVQYNEFRELAATARRMISVADKIMNQKLVSDGKDLKWIKDLRVKMQIFVESVYEGRENLEPKLPPKPDNEHRYDRESYHELDSHDWRKAAAAEVKS
ncbi:uncharacterized protein PpBr36_05986 [Pyricularia pennisetigena]|uniref:uncharacterized protein n=1 Tax=Pyricularia pennisetigena TaxID=1578925 RepID=UPI00114FE82B|nr:uncharacterized protein PpBr36_05986 [Pyricularia pennisetigena]TLS23259.1 hypothetical protein PpBr36_05986 [Pyricularia pennisetigena]